ncbi:FecR domain-containing protein [Sphingomonas sp. XMGL2]|uniref:FecR domain-containing protein n=2 Tax=Sphingomonas quercus TaxID=2842451 RepID=A0ABS6BKK0_9SPHN|nr:FecR domain-containing protein [Sphingomonas quercus]
MQLQGNDPIGEQALGWLVRTEDPAFEDWEGFQDWLEADPAHAARYHALAGDAATMAELLAEAPAPARPVPSAAPARIGRRRVLGSMAAAMLAVAGGWMVWQERPDRYAVETPSGVRQTVTLRDGTRIAMNGGTRLMLDRRDPRAATLEHGEALFTVVHDAAHPFRVAVGQDRLVDLGTVFDVTREGTVTTVSVAEGAVMWNPEAEAVRLDPGRRLRAEDGGARAVVGAVPLEAVGGWSHGRLIYGGAALGDVAADLSRALGVRVTVAPALAARPFRGTVLLDGLKEDPARIGALLGLAMRKQAEGGWLLTGAS